MSGPHVAWDYLVVDAEAAPDLGRLGRDGWELVGVATAAVPSLYFKRPALDFRDRVALDQKRRAYQQLGVPWSDDDGGRP